MAAKVTRLRTAPARTLRTAAEAFLDTIGSANTRRSYGVAIVKTVDAIEGRGSDGLIGHSRALDSVTDAEIGAALETLWGSAAVNTWNARRGGQMAELVHRAGLDRTDAPGLGRAVDAAALRHRGPLTDRDRPGHRPPRDPRAGEDAVADAV
ncbi:hypothetical protein ACWZHB_10775 [Nocardia sp. FBN12]|uniref:hypothetical protein n=1 Tax=Nocardia sp. FBN12 TaxID=3419766 RepID=UPI003CFEA429